MTCMALRGQMRCPPKRWFALVSEQISGSMHWPSFLTCQSGALWLTGHGWCQEGVGRVRGAEGVSRCEWTYQKQSAKMAGERVRETASMHGIYRLCSISWPFAKTRFFSGWDSLSCFLWAGRPWNWRSTLVWNLDCGVLQLNSWKGCRTNQLHQRLGWSYL